MGQERLMCPGYLEILPNRVLRFSRQHGGGRDIKFKKSSNNCDCKKEVESDCNHALQGGLGVMSKWAAR